MRNHSFWLLAALLPISAFSFAQKLKKADKTIVSNIQSHINFLSSPKLNGHVAGSEGEFNAEEYVHKQLEKLGVKGKAPNGSWFQKFNISDGREVLPASSFSINGKPLKLYAEYFPFCFSANKKTEATVAVALSENGVPWFADLRDLSGDRDSSVGNAMELIRLKAGHAAAKGATALIVFDKADSGQMEYKAKDDGPQTSIPVLYMTKAAITKYLADESANLDLKINVDLQEKQRTASNVIGFMDNNADSTILISAHLDDEAGVAELLEIARMLKRSPQRSSNYLFVVYSGEGKGVNGSAYFVQHPSEDPAKFSRRIDVTALGTNTTNQKGLEAVKEAINIISQANASKTSQKNK